MGQRFVKRLIGVLETRIFADDSNTDCTFRSKQSANDVVPNLQVRLGFAVETEMIKHLSVEALFVIVNGNLIYRVDVRGSDDSALGNITEQRYLAAFSFWNRTVTATQQQIGLNTDTAQFLYRVLRRLSFEFTSCGDIGQQSEVYIHHLVGP